MDPATRERLTTLFYILGRDHLPWGTLHKVIDEHVRVTDGERVYCSDAGRALAEAAIDRLLGPARDQNSSPVDALIRGEGWPANKGSRVFVKPECPTGGGARPGHAGIMVRIDIRGFVAVRHDAPSDELVYDINHLVPVEALIGRTFEHRDGGTCVLRSVDTSADTCQRTSLLGESLLSPQRLQAFTDGRFTLLPLDAKPANEVDSSPLDKPTAQPLSLASASNYVFIKTECPQRRDERPGHAGFFEHVEVEVAAPGMAFAWVRHADGRRVAYSFDQMLAVNDLVGRAFQHHAGETCTLADIHADVCTIRCAALSYEKKLLADDFTNGDFVLLAEQSTAEPPSADTPSTSDHEVIAARLRRALLAVTGVTEVYVKLDNSIADDWKARVTVTGGDDTEVALAIASALPVWFTTIGHRHVRAQVQVGNTQHAIRHIAFDRPAPNVNAEPGTAEPQTKQGLLRRLNTALDWSIRSTLFVFTSDASTAGMVRMLAEARLGPTLQGDHVCVAQAIRDEQLSHSLTPSAIWMLLAAAEDAARCRSCPLVIIADPEHRAELMRTNAWEVRTAVFDFDATSEVTP